MSIERVGVVGAGQMGGGIAEVSARAGAEVMVFDKTEELLTAGHNRIVKSLGRGVKIVAGRKKGRIELDYYDMDDLNDLLDALGTLQQRKNGGTKK